LSATLTGYPAGDPAIAAKILKAFATPARRATYDFTNLATLKGWTTALLVVDVAWGTFVTGAAALAGYSAARLLPAS
jgi:uncharacterized membrane protein